MSRSRINSAGPHAGPEQEVRMLRNTVTKLQQDLLHSNVMTQKVTEQLNCLMLLVRRAWSGDTTAAVNVANIVGVAPPDFEEHSDGFSTMLSSKPKNAEEDDPENFEPPKVFMRSKSRAVSNWAVLTIGLLNRDYKKLEQQEEIKARYYLQQRQTYLDQQLVYHKDTQFRSMVAHQQKEVSNVAQLKSTSHQNGSPPIQQSTFVSSVVGTNATANHHVPLRRVNSLTDISRGRDRQASIPDDKTFLTQPNQKNNRPMSCKTRAPAKHLYRPANQKQEPVVDLTWADLVVEPGHQLEQNVQRVENCFSDNNEVNRLKYRHQRRISYDDPRRYNVSGLYDAENALGPGSNVFRRRPPSAKIQRQSDSVRARPKSAVYANKNERPLKYETTRPLSAVVTSKPQQHRPPSGKNKHQHEQNDHHIPNHPVNTPVHTNGTHSNIKNDNEQLINGEEYYSDDETAEEIVYDESAFKKLGIDIKEVDRELQQVHQIKVNITKPKSVIQFEEDVQNMHDMEKIIRNTTKELQKKLGICEEGIVY